MPKIPSEFSRLIDTWSGVIAAITDLGGSLYDITITPSTGNVMGELPTPGTDAPLQILSASTTRRKNSLTWTSVDGFILKNCTLEFSYNLAVGDLIRSSISENDWDDLRGHVHLSGPVTNQNITAVGDVFTLDAGSYLIFANVTSAVTLTTSPFIADGTTDGETLTIVNVGSEMAILPYNKGVAQNGLNIEFTVNSIIQYIWSGIASAWALKAINQGTEAGIQGADVEIAVGAGDEIGGSGSVIYPGRDSLRVYSDGGAATTGGNNIKPGVTEGQILTLYGVDNSDYVDVPSGGNALNARGETMRLNEGAVIKYAWYDSKWREFSRYPIAEPVDVTTGTVAGSGTIAISKFSNVYRYASTGGAVTGVDFSGGLSGQRFWVEGTSDTDTFQIDDGGTVVCKFGIDLLLKDGDRAEFEFDGTNYNELRRCLADGNEINAEAYRSGADMNYDFDGATPRTNAMEFDGESYDQGGHYAQEGAIASQTFTANFTTNVLTVTDGSVFNVNDPLYLTNSGGALPTGLLAQPTAPPSILGYDYWIKTISTNDITLSATPGGAAVTFSDAGTGTHTLHFRQRYLFTARHPGIVKLNVDGILRTLDSASASQVGAKTTYVYKNSDIIHWIANYSNLYGRLVSDINIPVDVGDKIWIAAYVSNGGGAFRIYGGDNLRFKILFSRVI